MNNAPSNERKSKTNETNTTHASNQCEEKSSYVNRTSTSYTERYGWFCFEPPDDNESTRKIKSYSLIRDIRMHLTNLLRKINYTNSHWKRLILDDMMFSQFTAMFTKDLLMDLNISEVTHIREYESVCIDTKNTLDTIYLIHFDELISLDHISRSIDPFTKVMNYICILSQIDDTVHHAEHHAEHHAIHDTQMIQISKLFGKTLCGIYHINYDVSVISRNAFSLEYPQSMSILYNRQIDSSQCTVGSVPSTILDNVLAGSACCKNIGTRIASIFNMCEHYPVIFSSKSLMAINTAKACDDALKLVMSKEKKNKDNKVLHSYDVPRITLIIVDRSFDPLLPLLQCASTEGLYASLIPNQQKKRVEKMTDSERKIFSKLWTDAKSLDISTANEELASNTQTFIEAQKQMKSNFSQNTKLKMHNFTEMMINTMTIPHYVNAHSILIDGFTEVHKQAVQDKIYDEIELEDTLMMMIYPELDVDKIAEAVDLKDLTQQVESCITKTTDHTKKIKMTILLNKALQSHSAKGHGENTVIGMVKKFGLNNSRYISALQTIDNICEPVDGDKSALINSRRTSTYMLKESVPANKIRAPIIDPLKHVLKLMSMSTYRPKLFDTVMSYNLDTIDSDEYFCQVNNQHIDPIKGRSLRYIPNVNKSHSHHNIYGYHNLRLYIFILGGMTYHEIRLADLISNITRTNLVVGSTHILTPESYVRQLASLS